MNVKYELQVSNYLTHPVDCELLVSVQNDSKKTLSFRYPACSESCNGRRPHLSSYTQWDGDLGCYATRVQLHKYRVIQQEYSKIVQVLVYCDV